MRHPQAVTQFVQRVNAQICFVVFYVDVMPYTYVAPERRLFLRKFQLQANPLEI
jgi:hypothetical protein